MSHFYLIVAPPCKSTGQNLVDALKAQSSSFVRSSQDNNDAEMKIVSHQAWVTLRELFDFLRNEADYGRIDESKMRVVVCNIICDATQVEVDAMLRLRKLNKKHAHYAPASLRDTLNKIAHFDKLQTAYRVTKNGAHYVILSGKYKQKTWVIEIHMSKFCQVCRQALTQK